MKSIIIEDEPLAISIIKEFLSDFPEIMNIGEYYNGKAGLEAILEKKPDLVFLDIQIGQLTGIELIEKLEVLPLIIFTTAYDEYAVKAFEKNAVDYLLKPYSKKRFAQAIEKAKSRFAEMSSKDNANNSEKSKLDHIPVKEGDRTYIIPIKEISYILAAEDYTVIVANNKEYIKHATMKYFEENLPKEKFIRIHRSSIINIDFIKEINSGTKIAMSLTMNNGKILKISRQGNTELKNFLK